MYCRTNKGGTGKTKVLITGGKGYIGRALQESFNFHRWRTHDKITLWDLPEHDIEKVVPGDYDIVVHLAAMRLPAANANPEEAERVNVRGTEIVAKTFPNTYLVYASSCSCYGVNSGIADESSETAPTDTYGRTKLMAEDYVKKHSNSAILRFSTVYGASRNTRTDTLVNSWIENARNHRPLTVRGPESHRPIVHIQDIVSAIKFTTKKQLRGIFNIGGENLRKVDIVQSIASCYRVPVQYDGNGSDIRDYQVSFEKINQRGWRSRHTLRDELSRNS